MAFLQIGVAGHQGIEEAVVITGFGLEAFIQLSYE
jgi:hypothetical protein